MFCRIDLQTCTQIWHIFTRYQTNHMHWTKQPHQICAKNRFSGAKSVNESAIYIQCSSNSIRIFHWHLHLGTWATQRLFFFSSLSYYHAKHVFFVGSLAFAILLHRIVFWESKHLVYFIRFMLAKWFNCTVWKEHVFKSFVFNHFHSF